MLPRRHFDFVAVGRRGARDTRRSRLHCRAFATPLVLITEPLFYLVAIPVVLLTGISKTGFPGLFSGLAVPMLALVISPVQAAAIMLPILCLTDLWGLNAFRGIWDRRNLFIMIAGATVGIAIGGLTFRLVTDTEVKLVTGIIAVVFGLNNLFGWARNRPAAGASVPKGLFWSAISGFTSTIAHAGGPPAYAYLLPQRLERSLYVGTTVWFFCYVNYAKLVPYALLGQFRPANVLTALALAPLIPVGVRLGVALQRRANDRIFYLIAYWVMLLAGLKLIWDGLR
jgi:uncharacterized membrane protein YfcA